MKKIYSIMGALAIAASAGAQTLPNAVYSLDFEGAQSVADFGGVQIGDGALMQSSDPNFGTYYQNAPEAAVSTKATNFLRINQNALQLAANKTKNGVSLGFWVNPTVANTKFSNINYYYSVLFGFYSSDKDSAGPSTDWNWPMFTVNARQWMQINTAGAWDDFTAAENVNGSNIESVDWLKQHTTEEVVKDSEGNDSTIYVPTDFNDNWHYVALSFDPANNSTSLFIDGEKTNQWNNKAEFYGGENFIGQLASGKYDRLYLGGVAQWTWADPDPAFAYDDFTVYAGTLAEDQIELIMNIKRGNIGDAERLVIAQGQLQSAIDEGYEYIDELGETFATLGGSYGDYLMETIGEPSQYATIDDINAAIAKISAEQEKVAAVVAAYKNAESTIAELKALIDATNYPGAEAFNSVVEEVLNGIADPKSADEIDSKVAPLNEAKIKYVFSQDMPADGTGIDVTKLILHPWFVNADAEPTKDAEDSWYFEGMTGVLGGNTSPSTGNSKGWVNGNSFKVDDARVNWTQGRTCWNNWHNKTTVGTLDVHQDITGLPAGYYTVTADMITNTTPISGQQVYGATGGAQRVSPVLSGNGWDGLGTDLGNWESLTTDKVYVAEGQTLTIGAQSKTTGANYVGWFCVTNFRLQYFGTEADLAADVALKTEEVKAAIEQLTMAGDKKNAEKALADIAASAASDYEKISELSALIVNVKDNAAKEAGFTALNSIKDLAKNAENATVQAIYSNGAYEIEKAITADDATIDILPGLTSLYNAYIAYVASVEAAQAWGTEAATAEVNTQVANLEGATVETLSSNADKLIAIMTASISEFKASEAEPKDITGIVANASFAGDSDANWNITGSHANWYSECEFYNTNFDIYQVISGLPAGAYRVTVQGYYRDGGRDAAVANYNTVDEEGNNKYTANAYLYANAVHVPMLSMATDSIVGIVPGAHADGSTYAWWQPNSATAEESDLVSYPDGMNSAWYMMSELGKYADNIVDVMLAEGEDLKFGIVKTKTINTDWTIFDNFKLYYLGTEAPVAVETVKASASDTPSAIFSISGTKMNSLKKGINIVKMADGSVRKVLVK